MKKLTISEGISLLIDIIDGNKRHRDYDRVVEIANKMKMLITGENMRPLMRKFDRRESDVMFEQRVDITQHIVSTVSNNLMKPQYKIPRSNGMRRVLKYIDDNESQKLHTLEGILGKFWGKKSLDKYLNSRWIDLTNIDPNSFIVYEWGDFDNKRERAKPYPFEVSAEEAIYYKYTNNLLDFLVVLNEFEKGAGGIPEEVQAQNDGKVITKRYTLYFKGYSIVLDQLDREEERTVLHPKDTWTDGQEHIKIGNDVYLVHINASRLDFIPVERVGFVYDPSTRWRTCLPPIWNAVPILMKTIKANSELDLTISLHAHPQKIQYVRQCMAENCNAGRLPDNTDCPVCGGSGREKVTTTAQEVIELVMPRDKEDMIALDNVVKYISPAVDGMKFLSDYIRGLTEQSIEAIYNSQVFSRKQISETATKSNIDHENVYDALYLMAEAYADMWEASIHAITNITDTDEDLIYAYTFSRDFKMKSMTDLIIDLKTASDARADSFVKTSIQDDIAMKVYTDNPTELSKYKTEKMFYPYEGKTSEQVAMIVASVPPTDFNRVLWESYGFIFNEIELEQAKKGVNYYDLTRQKQWSILQRHINKIIKERESIKMPSIKEDAD